MSTFTHTTAIKADASTIWDALVDGDVTPAYYFGFQVHADPVEGGEFRYTAGGDDVILGAVAAIEPGRSLTTSFVPAWDEDVADLPESTVTYSIEPTDNPGVSMLTLVHEGMADHPTTPGIQQGWIMIVSGLKTVLETGAPLLDAA